MLRDGPVKSDWTLSCPNMHLPWDKAPALSPDEASLLIDKAGALSYGINGGFSALTSITSQLLSFSSEG